MNNEKLSSMAPVIDKGAQILILGSFPGPMALAKRQYYAYPRNQFWKIIFDILGVEAPASYSKKLDILKSSGIGLWDVIGSCRRKGASDSSISNPVFNDIPSLIKHYPKIKTVFCNGTKSYSICMARYKDIGVPFVYLPSTSPANAVYSYEHKKRSWSKILDARE